MPIVLIEGDRNLEGAKQRGFDWDELKTAYNGRSVRSRGMKNNGDEMYEPPFRGAILLLKMMCSPMIFIYIIEAASVYFFGEDQSSILICR